MISIIIPVFNGARFLEEAIESALAQKGTFKKEIIIIDDGSTDNTSIIAKQYSPEVRYFHQENQGVAAARNYGAELAKGNFFAFLDGDDLWDKEKLKKQHTAIQGCDLAFSYVQHFHSDKKSERYTQNPNPMPGYFASTLLITKEAFEAIGGFTKNIQYGEFIEFYSRSKQLGCKEIMVPDVLAFRRIHGNNMTIKKKGSYAQSLKAHLDRQRGHLG